MGLKGKRIKLTSDITEDINGKKVTSLKSGSEGTIVGKDGIDQIHVDWDNGSTLAVSKEYGDEFEIEGEQLSESKKIKSFKDFK